MSNNYIMKKIAFLFSLVLFAQIAFAQTQKRVFKPNWKVGEKKTITITDVKVSYEGDSIKESETNTVDGEISIVRMDNANYYVDITYSNVVLRSFEKFYDKLGEEMPAYKKVQLKFKVNKQTGKSDLINWKEANDYVLKSFDEVSRIIKTKAPEAEMMLDIVFTPIKDIFKTKESAEGYFTQELGCVLSPFGKNYSTTDTLVITQSTKNPFGQDSLSATTRSILSNINESAGTCDIISSTEMDLSQVVQMIKSMMQAMMKKMKPDDKEAKEALAELDNIKMEMTNTEVLTFNFKTSWTTLCVQKTVVNVNMPGKSGKQYSTKTITVK